MDPDITIQLTAQCLCKDHTFTDSIARSSLPIETGCCHCTSCRRATGAMFTCLAPWPGPTADVLRSSLQQYAFSEKITMFFCGRCSSPMFYHYGSNKPQSSDGQEEEGRLEVCFGALPNLGDVEIVRIRDHLYVEDTLDGGASVMMRQPNPDGATVPCWAGMRNGSAELGSNWPPKERRTEALQATPPQEVPVRCHCRGVDLVLRRGEAFFSAMKREELPFFVDPKTNRVLASFDACDSCRLACGSQPMYWTFALLKQIGFPRHNVGASSQNEFPQSYDDLRLAVSESRDPRLGTLATYNSSAGVQRYFCSLCSACVFYTAKNRPDVVDLALGLLDAPDGARAESLLSWNYGMMGYTKDVRGGWREALMHAIEHGSEQWRMEQDIPKNFRRLFKENSHFADG